MQGYTKKSETTQTNHLHFYWQVEKQWISLKKRLIERKQKKRKSEWAKNVQAEALKAAKKRTEKWKVYQEASQ